jgi:Lysophospholipase L1 and related esterases
VRGETLRIKRGRKTKIPVFVWGPAAILAIAGVSFLIASFWQSYEQKPSAAQTQSPALIADGQEELEQTAAKSEEAANASVSASAGGSLNVEPRAEYPHAVPLCEVPAENSYFDSAIFFGDSISTGIPLYGVMPGADVVAFSGINTTNILTREVIDMGGGERVTMLAAAEKYGEKSKVYIMLGSNGLSYTQEQFLSGYREFIRAVKAQYPGAAVYLQSIPPVTDQAPTHYPDVSNQKIDAYNLGIMNLAREMGVYYLDVAAVMVNEEGKLPEDGHSGDGMHLSADYYYRWFEYLRYHIAEEKK